MGNFGKNIKRVKVEELTNVCYQITQKILASNNSLAYKKGKGTKNI